MTRQRRFVVGQRVLVRGQVTMYAGNPAAPKSTYANMVGTVITVGVDRPGSEGYDYRVAFNPRDGVGAGFMEYELQEVSSPQEWTHTNPASYAERAPYRGSK